MPYLPRITITMGYPAGIEPEIITKALLREGISQVCRPFVLGDVGPLKEASEGIGPRSFHAMENPGDVSESLEAIDVLPLKSASG